MSQKRLTPSDGMFLYMETPETKMHVAGLLPFSAPPDARPDYVRSLVNEIQEAPVFPPWSRRLSTPDVLLNPPSIVDRRSQPGSRGPRPPLRAPFAGR
ncbi:MAG TPA: wax ester/triacylglycerol synthase domain-containing protein [Polyangiaceae bacterium]|nr:wax ester/triacylglycerol synthase domain-containing protein [Polyangiaceae bacterium]